MSRHLCFCSAFCQVRGGQSSSCGWIACLKGHKSCVLRTVCRPRSIKLASLVFVGRRRRRVSDHVHGRGRCGSSKQPQTKPELGSSTVTQAGERRLTSRRAVVSRNWLLNRPRMWLWSWYEYLQDILRSRLSYKTSDELPTSSCVVPSLNLIICNIHLGILQIHTWRPVYCYNSFIVTIIQIS